MKTSLKNEIVYLYLILKLITLHLNRKKIEFKSQFDHLYKDLQSYLEYIDFNLIEL